MNVKTLQHWLQNLHMRKEFYLVCIIAIILLIIFIYKMVPAVTKPGSSAQRWLAATGNFLLALFAAAVAVGSILFWLIGNNHRG
ncbi:hypothetical protein FPZ43_11930 [Mucilaginibacter pallidiroseus]|uniref:Uncharacterized protein n=1 Tax=Mucilaginibacter pallidiroseus TaxID=2599295 RepID=A0A563UCB7_9SPHI|nr:hypothetical protein [Mucilaginibacter pallidiroseus]TWR28966.1 hypothetical protein FPZ43_11930 [Mucilaginibacter pallidiroseus]